MNNTLPINNINTTVPKLQSSSGINNKPKKSNLFYYVIIIVIIIFLIMFIIFIYLYLVVFTIENPFQSLTPINNIDSPPGTLWVQSTMTSGVDILPPASITVYAANPSRGDIILRISPSSLYTRGSLIKVGNLLNQSGTQYNIIVESAPGVTINLATSVTSNIVRPNTWAVLVATNTNVFTLINSGSVDRVNITTQEAVNTIRRIYDPLGIPYRYFFQGVYYATIGARGTYQTPVNIVTAPDGSTVFQYVDELGNPTSIINPRTAIGDPFLATQTVGSLPVGLVSLLLNLSYLIPGDPINTWLKNVGNNIQEVIDNTRNNQPISPIRQTINRNNLYLIAAGIDLLIVIGLFVWLIYLG